MKADPTPFDRARDIFLRRGGILRTVDAIRLGIHPRTLYAMRDSGLVEPVARGLHRLKELPPLRDPDLVPVALKVRDGVICLISALSFHELTTQIPHQIYVAIPRGAERPRLEFPPIRVFWFSGAVYSEGTDTHDVDGVPIHIYTPEKTVADCFKYRHKIGIDVAVEALKTYRRRRRLKVDDLVRFARICRVENVMRPYLEALL